MDANDQTTALLMFFKALADANRLKIIGLLANQPSTVEQLASQLALSSSTVSHHLSRLSEAGLVSARAEGYYSIYSLETENLEKLSHMLLARDTLPALAEDVDVDAYDRKVINEFVTSDGRIKAFPVQLKKMEVLLKYATKSFELNTRYTEKQVNEILKAFNEDFATLRRELIDIKYLARDHGEYWLTELGYNSARRYR
jgi:DNA-binding HxlR family transcriptional regulator